MRRFRGVPVFYEVGKTNLHRYADFGLTFVNSVRKPSST